MQICRFAVDYISIGCCFHAGYYCSHVYVYQYKQTVWLGAVYIKLRL